MNAKISVLVICVKAVIYLVLYNLNDCTFKTTFHFKIRSLRKKCLYSELLCSLFSRIRSEYRHFLRGGSVYILIYKCIASYIKLEI